jgi:hypothetical protein
MIIFSTFRTQYNFLFRSTENRRYLRLMSAIDAPANNTLSYTRSHELFIHVKVSGDILDIIQAF